MKYYIIAGEASGDLHASNLIPAIRKNDPRAEFRAWGGDKMQAAGAEVVKHYRELAFMGFIEVIKNIRTILRNLKNCKADILNYKPDVLILVDYPGFNLRIAKWAKENGFKVIFYISPQVWAWKESRVKLIRTYIDKMIVILPFEAAFYHKWDYKVDYVGHPLIQVVEKFRSENIHISKDQKTIALLPGSRKQELQKKLPIMLDVCKHFPDYTFVVAKAPGLDDEFYTSFLEPYKNVQSVRDETYKLLMKSSAALVTSGTATLETALFEVPEVVCYKGSAISYHIAKRLIKIKYISLVNLIMDKEVVKELIQHELTVPNLLTELNALLFDEKRKQQLKEDYSALKELLTRGGNASENAARIIYEFLSGK
jgi:lipid-A-disaccharide synthase